MWGSHLIHAGDLPLTMAAAVAIFAWLVTARARRLAFWWGFLFVLGIGLVAASKIAFLAWGVSLPAIHFRTLSGHATGMTAVATTAFYLAFRRGKLAVRRAGLLAGLGLGGLMALLLVLHDEHSLAEAGAGWVVGALVSLGGIRLAGEALPGRVQCGIAWSAIAFISSVSLLMHLPLGYLMWRVARAVTHQGGFMAIAGH